MPSDSSMVVVSLIVLFEQVKTEPITSCFEPMTFATRCLLHIFHPPLPGRSGFALIEDDISFPIAANASSRGEETAAPHIIALHIVIASKKRRTCLLYNTPSSLLHDPAFCQFKPEPPPSGYVRANIPLGAFLAAYPVCKNPQERFGYDSNPFSSARSLKTLEWPCLSLES